MKKSVLLVGIDPALIDFSSPDYAPFNLDAERVLAGIRADRERLRALGYEPDWCMTDFGETAEQVVQERLKQKSYDCVMIGAGVRALPGNFLLFEKLMNVVHSNAPQAKLCFNTSPRDIAEAVTRWI